MLRYFFHIRGPDFYTEDALGIPLPSEEAARQYAERIASDLGNEDEYSGHTVILATERGDELLRVAVLSNESTRH
jgi:hypothetical protein